MYTRCSTPLSIFNLPPDKNILLYFLCCFKWSSIYIFFFDAQTAVPRGKTIGKVESLGSVPVWVCMLLLSDSNARGEWPPPTDGVGTSSFRRDGSFPSIESPAIFDGPCAWSETWDLCFCLLYYLTWSIVGEREFVLGFRFEVTR